MWAIDYFPITCFVPLFPQQIFQQLDIFKDLTHHTFIH